MPNDSTTPNTTPELTPKIGLSIDEACHASGIGRTKLYEALSNGKLIAKKAGRRTIIRPEDLEAYVASLPVAVFPAPETDSGLAAA